MANEEKYLPAIHPGKILDAEFLKPLNLPLSGLRKA